MRDLGGRKHARMVDAAGAEKNSVRREMLAREWAISAHPSFEGARPAILGRTTRIICGVRVAGGVVESTRLSGLIRGAWAIYYGCPCGWLQISMD